MGSNAIPVCAVAASWVVMLPDVLHGWHAIALFGDKRSQFIDIGLHPGPQPQRLRAEAGRHRLVVRHDASRIISLGPRRVSVTPRGPHTERSAETCPIADSRPSTGVSWTTTPRPLGSAVSRFQVRSRRQPAPGAGEQAPGTPRHRPGRVTPRWLASRVMGTGSQTAR